MRKLTGTAVLALGLIGPATAEPAHVAITAIVEHPALDAVREGLKAGLAGHGFREGVEARYTFQSAQGAQGTAVQIARGFAGANPAVIVAISTPSAQSVAAATRTIPVVFSAVTDPVGAKLVASGERPGGNVTGVSDMAPVAEQLALVKAILPKATRLGVLYNPGEANAVSILALVRREAARLGLSIVEATVTKSADAQSAARSLLGRADAVYVPTDNTVVSALEAVVAVCEAAKLPLFSGDTDSVARGAVASVGLNYRNVGLETAKVVARVLRGEKPADIPVANAAGTDLHLNRKAAAATGVELPADLVARAAKVLN
jgi:putative ABC transport system substrate-binding protein